MPQTNNLHILPLDTLVALDVWRRIKPLSDPNSRQVTLLWTPVSLFLSKCYFADKYWCHSSEYMSPQHDFCSIFMTTLFIACFWLSSRGEHPRLHCWVVAERPKLDHVEGRRANPCRGLHHVRTVWLHRQSCSQHRLQHRSSHHHLTEEQWRWATPISWNCWKFEAIVMWTPAKHKAYLSENITFPTTFFLRVDLFISWMSRKFMNGLLQNVVVN